MPIVPKDPIALSYIAGVMDSDGWIGMCRTRRNDSGRCAFQPGVNLTQVEPEAILFFDLLYGGYKGVYKRTKNWKPIYRWQLSSMKLVKEFLQDILPYLKIKKQRAELLIKFIEIREDAISKNGCPRGSYSNHEYELFEQMRVLNSKGVVDTLITESYME